jgi:hypothetical protein
MHNLEHVFGWFGRGRNLDDGAPRRPGRSPDFRTSRATALRLARVCAMTLALGACTSWGPFVHGGGPDPLTDLADVLGSDPGSRETMWLSARKDNSSPRAQLHTALLQSVPGHTGFDPGAAEHSLQALLTGDAPADVATAARARLAELKAAGNCQTRVEELRKQVTKIVEIERKMNHREKP